MRGKYAVLVAILVLAVAFGQGGYGAAAFGLIVLVAMVTGLIVLWRLSGLANAITFRRDR